ncbi:hypothetical protein CRENPOLYSF2_3370001 [Crenothrix polyspora]|uniref:Uncharacterized protein n=1 Tax=Crenothrix polyspora TaxID=360316 RepID=A0A1R4HB75_9GAMM|nr:hypothetical protein [Crenothrix polyspora]SJM93508.1 hypothetical protein CRENPOLYSF2_3370001 [Crenothrix polyspora]
MKKLDSVRNTFYEIYSQEEYSIPTKLSVGEYDNVLPLAVKEILMNYFVSNLEEGCFQYPSDYSPITESVKEAIRQFNHLNTTSQIVLTAGSTEALRLIFDTYLNDEDYVSAIPAICKNRLQS